MKPFLSKLDLLKYFKSSELQNGMNLREIGGRKSLNCSINYKHYFNSNSTYYNPRYISVSYVAIFLIDKNITYHKLYF